MCDDRLLLYKFISIFHILLPGIPNFLSVSISRRDETQVLAEESFMTNKTYTVVNMETIFFHHSARSFPTNIKIRATTTVITPLNENTHQ